MKKVKNKRIISVLAVFLSITLLGAVSGLFSQGVGGSVGGGAVDKSISTTAPVVTEKSKEWSEFSLPSEYSDFTPYATLVDGDRLIVTGNRDFIFYSDDGKTFNRVSIDLESGDRIQDIVIYQDMYYFISFKQGLYVFDREFTSYGDVFSEVKLKDIAVNGNKMLVCGANVLHYTEDGENWKKISVGVSYPVAFSVGNNFLVCSGSGELLSVGNSGSTAYLSKSTGNGNISTKIFSNSNQLYNACVADGKIAIVGVKGAAYFAKADEPQNFHATGNDTDSLFNFEDVCFYDGYFYAVGSPSGGSLGSLFRFDESTYTWKAVEGIAFPNSYELEVYNGAMYVFSEGGSFYVYQ